MVRQKIKGTKVRRTLAPEEEPNFYVMSDVTPTTCDDSPPSTPPPLEMEMDRARSVSTAASAGLAGKDRAFQDRAFQARQERLNTVRDVLKQTESLCDNVEMDFDDTRSPTHNTGSNTIPSVSPVESEESDSEESNAPMFQIPQPTNRAISMLEASPLESLEPRYEDMMTADYMNSGDLLFFEGKPFHYLEHLDALPTAPVKPKQSVPSSFYARDSLQSLMRVDPKALMGSAF